MDPFPIPDPPPDIRVRIRREDSHTLLIEIDSVKQTEVARDTEPAPDVIVAGGVLTRAEREWLVAVLTAWLAARAPE